MVRYNSTSFLGGIEIANVNFILLQGVSIQKNPVCFRVIDLFEPKQCQTI